MPIDQKRINGPESSVPYDIYIHSEVKENRIQLNGSKRHDGRSNNELRDICKVMTKIISRVFMLDLKIDIFMREEYV